MGQKPEVKIDPEDNKTGKTRFQPRFRIALGLAVALLLVTCAVAAAGLMTYFRGKCGNNRFTIKACVNGQTFTEEVEVDRENGMVVYRDDVSNEHGEIVQTKEGLTVLYYGGNCYVLEDESNNQTDGFDFDAVEASMEFLAYSSEVPRFDVDQVVFLNRSVPVSPEDDVILRSQLPPVCHDVTLYRVQKGKARDQGLDTEQTEERSHHRARRGDQDNPYYDPYMFPDHNLIGRVDMVLYSGPCEDQYQCFSVWGFYQSSPEGMKKYGYH
ncbi:uncharacterized protein LOC118407023 isoform X1 [Branchiostoma floridae]|uniref:Uncharacterized protein LOC118407023 isoform X1 n=1 Tax=Branchiostoma floridae TaxID=7739 RepID=A0A9J7HPX8_BRAFL|nr:uncharacterized protein LOC118407023 isoform X1 [Branchiostoma floridae]